MLKNVNNIKNNGNIKRRYENNRMFKYLFCIFLFINVSVKVKY